MIVYGLIDPRNGELRYVGKTVGKLQTRWRAHIAPSKLGDTYRCRWIRQLLAAGLKPEPFVIETHGSEDDLNGAEVWWIAYLRSIGCRLTNTSDGGDGATGVRWSEDRKVRMSEHFRGRVVSDETRKLLSESRKGLPSPRRGKPLNLSPEARERLAASGRLRSGEKHPMFGKKHSADTIARLTDTNRMRCVRVVDDLGRAFESVTEAALAIGVTKAAITSAIKRGGKVRGLTFQRLKD